MVIIGLVGGIASGKTTVAEQLRGLGAEVVAADQIGHEVLRDSQIQQALRERWGASVLDQHDHVDRAAVARIVFAPPPEGPRQLAFLEQITHPQISLKVRRRLADLAHHRDLKAVVLDAPLLLKVGWGEICDKLVFVEATRSLRLQRARERGWSEADFAAREAAQESLDEKRKCADWVIDNSHSPSDTFRQVQRFWRSFD